MEPEPTARPSTSPDGPALIGMTSPLNDRQTLQRRNHELAILNTVAQTLSQEVDLDRALHAVLAAVAELFGLQTGWIFLVEPSTGATYLAAAQHLPPGLTKVPERMVGGCFCLDIYQAGDLDSAANVDIITCSRLSKLVAGSGGLRFHASIPLYAQEQKLGVLNVASSEWDALADDDLRLLSTVGDLLSIAIARAQLFARSTALGAAEERNRLAREIHDTLAQGLSAIALHLETADALLMGDKNEPVAQARAYLQQALKLARNSLDEARRSVLDLRAAPLEGRTLAQALTQLVAQQKPTPVAFTLRGDDRPLPVHVEAGLYRIAQEALTNVMRHAAAQQVRLELELRPTRVMLLVEDDGQGFDLAQIERGRFGLVGLNERVHLLGGELHLESSPGVGTKIQVVVPL